jgi:hypothetical protein
MRPARALSTARADQVLDAVIQIKLAMRPQAPSRRWEKKRVASPCVQCAPP